LAIRDELTDETKLPTRWAGSFFGGGEDDSGNTAHPEQRTAVAM